MMLYPLCECIQSEKNLQNLPPTEPSGFFDGIFLDGTVTLTRVANYRRLKTFAQNGGVLLASFHEARKKYRQFCAPRLGCISFALASMQWIFK